MVGQRRRLLSTTLSGRKLRIRGAIKGLTAALALTNVAEWHRAAMREGLRRCATGPIRRVDFVWKTIDEGSRHQ